MDGIRFVTGESDWWKRHQRSGLDLKSRTLRIKMVAGINSHLWLTPGQPQGAPLWKADTGDASEQNDLCCHLVVAVYRRLPKELNISLEKGEMIIFW